MSLQQETSNAKQQIQMPTLQAQAKVRDPSCPIPPGENAGLGLQRLGGCASGASGGRPAEQTCAGHVRSTAGGRIAVIHNARLFRPRWLYKVRPHGGNRKLIIMCYVQRDQVSRSGERFKAPKIETTTTDCFSVDACTDGRGGCYVAVCADYGASQFCLQFCILAMTLTHLTSPGKAGSGGEAARACACSCLLNSGLASPLLAASYIHVPPTYTRASWLHLNLEVQKEQNRTLRPLHQC